MLGILGSGFGLYGYLPAAVAAGHDQILLPARYQSKFDTRTELRRFVNNIVWVKSDDAVLRAATTLVVSRRPADQFLLLPDLLSLPNLKNIVFEKPLAPSPEEALRMLELLNKTDKKYVVGFIFRFIPWAKVVSDCMITSPKEGQTVWGLKWHFQAEHYRNNRRTWKRDYLQGGGPIRFYGIQMIALLAQWGFDEVIKSEVRSSTKNGEQTFWRAIFRGARLPEFRIEIDSNSVNPSFCVKNVSRGESLYSGSNIFGQIFPTNTSNSVDHRSLYLERLLAKTEDMGKAYSEQILAATNLWGLVESHTEF